MPTASSKSTPGPETPAVAPPARRLPRLFPCELFLVSADTRRDLVSLLTELLDYLDRPQPAPLHDLAFTYSRSYEPGRECLAIFFPAEEGSFRKFHPLRLPEHETAYALTVHKSQGSEFDRVLLVLPDQDSPVLTRELLYTGLTRARESVQVWGQEKVFQDAVSRRTVRMSGLRDALWE